MMSSAGSGCSRSTSAAIIALLSMSRPILAWNAVPILPTPLFQQSCSQRLRPSTSTAAPYVCFSRQPHRRNGGRHRRRLREDASSSQSLVRLDLFKGFVPTVDDDINLEIADADMSLADVFFRELDQGGNFFDGMKAVMQRRKDQSGDYENKYSILADNRNYGNRELIDKDHMNIAPVLDDLNQIEPSFLKLLWMKPVFRVSVIVGAYFFFPVLCTILNTLVDISPDEFCIINEQFTPGIGILYGTFVALTLDILYDRQGKVQENASVEASLLSQVLQNILSLFRDDPIIAREATQIIADQVRIIVYRSRGAEMLSIMRADPYARILSLVDHYQRDTKEFTSQKEAVIDSLRSELPSLMEARAKRLSDEASSLPPTHFLVLLLLTALSLIGFTAATLSITDANGKPPLESGAVFAGLTAIYSLFYNFCKDMNEPFDGVYQIKRSSAASYLLQIKWIVANQSFGNDISFDTCGLAPVYDGNVVVELGVGDFTPISDLSKEETATTIDAVATSTVAAVAEITAVPDAAKVVTGEATIAGQGAAPSATTPVASGTTHVVPSGETIASVGDTSGVTMTEKTEVVATTNTVDESDGSLNASSFLPQNKGGEGDTPLVAKGAERQSEKVAHGGMDEIPKEAVSHFQSLSGFGSDGPDHSTSSNDNVRISSEAVTRGQPSTSQVYAVSPSSYFRSMGGFCHNQ